MLFYWKAYFNDSLFWFRYLLSIIENDKNLLKLTS